MIASNKSNALTLQMYSYVYCFTELPLYLFLLFHHCSLFLPNPLSLLYFHYLLWFLESHYLPVHLSAQENLQEYYFLHCSTQRSKNQYSPCNPFNPVTPLGPGKPLSPTHHIDINTNHIRTELQLTLITFLSSPPFCSWKSLVSYIPQITFCK